jgi:hypothetical protein
MILAQVGWGKSDYVEAGIADDSLGGAVLGPRDDEPTEIAALATSLQKKLGKSGLVILDPQFYVTTIQSARDGKLPAYPYYVPSLTRASFGPTEVGKYAKDVLDFQAPLQVNRWVSPTVLFNGFRDPWSQIALSLGQASITEWKGRKPRKPLLVSLVVDELALRDRPALDEYLDTISTLEADGFYIIVRRNDINYPAAYEEDALVNLMYLTYVLGDLNSFEVIYGYTDLVGSLLLAAGAKGTSSGWYSNLRQFSLKRFLPSMGGRQPRDRYTSRQLMNSILVNPELAQVDAAKKLPAVLSGTGYDSVMESGPLGASWPRRTQCLHHWKVLAALDAVIAKGKKVDGRLATAENLINIAQATYSDLGSAGVTFEPTNGPREGAMWQRAIKRFRAEVGLV